MHTSFCILYHHLRLSLSSFYFIFFILLYAKKIIEELNLSHIENFNFTLKKVC